MRFSTPLHASYEAWLRERAGNGVGPIGETSRPGAPTGVREASPDMVMIPWGPADADGEPVCEVPGDFGEFELEYAAIRRAAGVIDLPNRTVLRVTGADRLEFLGRMLTQDVRQMAPGTCAASFLLNRKGRIEGDLYLVELGEEVFIDIDVHQADAVADGLGRFVLADDVRIDRCEGAAHRLAMHGRRAGALLDAAVGGAMPSLDNARAARIVMAGVETVVFRRDVTGEPGFECIVPRDAATRIWMHLLDASVSVGEQIRRPRPIGWYAFNVARIEAGTPMFNIDFGTTSLPHETGMLASRVSFRKGCYLGQEIVARMEALGKPKQILVSLAHSEETRKSDAGEGADDCASLPPLPVAGAPLAREGDGTEPVGVITSSALSPLSGGQPVMMGMVRVAYAKPGQQLVTWADEREVRCVVRELGPVAGLSSS